MKVAIVGAGLAGCECALQLAKHDIDVLLFEMKPKVKTPAHSVDTFAEIVCSNSFKGKSLESASGLLKAELELLDCELLKVAKMFEVPAGGSLAVDRKEFTLYVNNLILNNKHIKVIHEEVEIIPQADYVIIATGPLTSDKLSHSISIKFGQKSLSFFDASAPIVEAESVDPTHSFWSGRYGKDKDYLNCPMNKDEYQKFYDALTSAETVQLREFEKGDVFEGCMPIEVLAKRGFDSLRFGPLKPVGLTDPTTGRYPYACVQLRKENVDADCFGLVGFQTNLKFSEQKRVFSMIPALHSAEFLKYGVMHRNTFINSPEILEKNYKVKNENIFFAGQISGVEGYVESIASGLVCSLDIFRLLNKMELVDYSNNSVIGALTNYVSTRNSVFQPMNANYAIVCGIDANKKDRKIKIAERSLCEIKQIVEDSKWI